eukprot:367686_1
MVIAAIFVRDIATNILCLFLSASEDFGLMSTLCSSREAESLLGKIDSESPLGKIDSEAKFIQVLYSKATWADLELSAGEFVQILPPYVRMEVSSRNSIEIVLNTHFCCRVAEDDARYLSCLPSKEPINLNPTAPVPTRPLTPPGGLSNQSLVAIARMSASDKSMHPS